MGRGLDLLGGASVAILFGAACSAAPPRATVPYSNDFVAALGAEWSSRGGGWSVVDGKLYNDGAHNVPLWLDAALPDDVRIRFTAESRSPAVDLKCELFADGKEHATGYVVILSGWNNSKSLIARLDEHGPPRSEAQVAALRAEVAADAAAAASRHRDRRDTLEKLHRGEPGHGYRFVVERKGHDLRFFVDDVLHLEYFDPSPLRGPGHDRFAFNNWASEVRFDDLQIEPLR